MHVGLATLPPFGDLSIIIDAAVHVRRVEIAEHLKRGGSVRRFRVTLLILLQVLDVLFQFTSDGLISLALGVGKFNAVGLELIVDGGHGRVWAWEKT